MLTWQSEVALSLDVPAIVRMPVGTGWPLLGDVIFTPCAIDDDNCDAGSGSGFVTVVFPVTSGRPGIGRICPYALSVHMTLIRTVVRIIPATYLLLLIDFIIYGFVIYLGILTL
jgi:hypothetical protein